MSNAEYCVSCGDTIPEGRMMCPGCESGDMKHCDTCKHKDTEKCLECFTGEEYEGITQFDRIRNMSIKELAEEIVKDFGNYFCNPKTNNCSNCIDCAKKWLESEVEGE